MRIGTLLSIAIVLLFLPAVTGCVAKNGLPDTGPDYPAALSQVPSPVGLPAKLVSATQHIDADKPANSGTLVSSGFTVGDPSTATAPAGGVEWGIYEVGPYAADNAPESLVFNLAGSTGTVWIGMSNYTKGSWDWMEVNAPFSTWMDLPLPGSGQYYRTSDGACFIVVLVYDGGHLSFDGALVNLPVNEFINESNWTIYNIIDGPDYGQHSSATLVNGKPAVVFNDSSRKEIMYARATVEAPASQSDWVTMYVDKSDSLGGGVDVAYINGVPCVVYEQTVDQDVYFAYSDVQEPTGEANWTAHEFDTSGIRSPQVVVKDGVPALAYITSNGLRYAESNVAWGSWPAAPADWDTIDVDTDGFMYNPQLATVSDEPVIAYQRADSGDKELRYAWPDTIASKGPSGLSMTWTIITVDAVNTNSGNLPSLWINDNKPYIAYQNIYIDEYLRFALCDTATPATAGEWTLTTVYDADNDNAGRFPSVTFLGGRPLVACNHNLDSTGYLSLGYPSTDTPSDDGAWDLNHIDTATGYYINEETSAIALLNGSAAVIFRTSDGLKYAYYNP